MREKQVFLMLCILICAGGSSAARSFQPTSFDYDYQIESRSEHTRQKGKNGRTTTTPRPLIQQYWQNFVRNLPTLPPLRWNMTNSLGNLFTAGAQQIIETPIAMHHLMEEPIRKRKVNRKRKTTKKNKNRKRLTSGLRNYYYDNSYHGNQLQLQPLGVDKNRVMHLYEPSSGQFYALQVEPQPYYNHYSQYNAYDSEASYANEEQDDGYYQNSAYEDQDSGHDGGDEDEGYNEDNGSNVAQYEPESNVNDYDNDESENHGDNNTEYDDNVEVVDNWGYSDEEIFADRKIKEEKNNLKALAGSLIKIRKDLLKPETVGDVVNQLSNDKTDEEKTKPKLNNKDADKQNIELGRDVRGSLIKNNIKTKRKQNGKNKTSFKLVPRAKGEYYIFPGNIFS